MTSITTYRKNWKRVLYEKQPYDDNYVDPNRFLDQLDYEVGSNIDHRSAYMKLLYHAVVVVQHFTVVVIFLTVYRYVAEGTLDYKVLAVFDCILLSFGTCIHVVLTEIRYDESAVKTVMLFGICLRIAAPVLQALTSSFSSDTIHALAIASSAVHLVFNDYSKDSTGEASVRTVYGTLSLNAAMFASIILASRFHNIETVAGYILLAVIAFFLFPKTALLLRSISPKAHIAFAVIKLVVASFLLWSLSMTLFIVFELMVVFLWLIGPLWLLLMQDYKRALRGPWDIK